MASQVLFYNGIIYNTAPNGENYQYMIVDESSGFVVKCGHETDVASSWQGTKHDLQGKYVLPGLHDSHIHTYLLGSSINRLNLSNSKSLSDLQSSLKSYAESHPNLHWVVGEGWDQGNHPLIPS